MLNVNFRCVNMLVTGTHLQHFSWQNSSYDHQSGYSYNPLTIASSIDSEECLKILFKHEFFQKLFSGEENLKFLAKNNLFSFGTKIRPATLITKRFKTFVEKCFRSDKAVLHKCIGCILEDGLDYFSVFLLMLRLGATVNFPRYWLDHVGMAGCALHYFCAMLKYSVRDTYLAECYDKER